MRMTGLIKNVGCMLWSIVADLGKNPWLEMFLLCSSPFQFILLQFDCTNTLNDQLLERVTVQMEPSDAYDVICCIPAPSLAYNQPGMCYTLVQIPQDDPTAGMHWEGVVLHDKSLRWTFCRTDNKMFMLRHLASGCWGSSTVSFSCVAGAGLYVEPVSVQNTIRTFYTNSIQTF